MHTSLLLGWSRLALCLIFLSGCAVDQKKEVATYRKVLDAQAAPRPVQEAEETEPLTLQAAMNAANADNEQLALRGEDYLQALIDKDRAGAAFLPTVNLGATYFTQDAPGAASPTGANTRIDVPVQGQMNLFNGFRDLANVRRTAAVIDVRKAQLLDLQASVLLNVAQVYYQILRSQRSVEVLENSLRTQEERVRDIEARQQAGIARPLDVAQTQSQAAATRVVLVQARADVRNGRATLAFLTRLDVARRPLVDRFVVPAARPDEQALLAVAAIRRYDLSAARYAVDAAWRNVQYASGAYWPTISVNVNYFLQRQSTPTDSDWNGLISANLPIFSAGVIHANVRTALSQLRQANLAESLLRRQIQQDVRIGAENLLASDQRLVELQTQLRSGREGLRQAEESYKVGLATNLERLTSQDQLLSAQLQLASEQYNNTLQYLNLRRIVGELDLAYARQVEPATRAAMPGPITPPDASAASRATR